LAPLVGQFVDVLQDHLQFPPHLFADPRPALDDRIDLVRPEFRPRDVGEDPELLDEQPPQQALVVQFELLLQIERFDHVRPSSESA
jgi:hypothetical protein